MNGLLEVDGWCIVIRDDRPDYEKKLALMSMREVKLYVWGRFFTFFLQYFNKEAIFVCVFILYVCM